jgi:hypothetical protein
MSYVEELWIELIVTWVPFRSSAWEIFVGSGITLLLSSPLNS